LPAAPQSNYKTDMENPVIVILGCTASGKGTLARCLARHLEAEIVSVDSMKVYRGMDIGTAKPSPAELAAVPHHLIDIADPWEPFSAARFVELADLAVAEIHRRGRPVIAVGGTLLYFKCWYQGLFAGPGADPAFRSHIRRRARTEGPESLHAELARVDPQAAARIHRHDLRRIERALEVYYLTGQPISSLQRQWERPELRRPDWRWVLVGLRRSREDLNRRINRRVRQMVTNGLVDEVRRLAQEPCGMSPQARQAVGYAELLDHFAGLCSLEEAIERIKIHSRRLAKQQRTWLKRLTGVHWLEADSVEDTSELLPQVLDRLPLPRKN